MGILKLKDGVILGKELAPAGARILDVLKRIVSGYSFDVTITSGRDGEHSGPADPHHKGEAFDLRSKDLTLVQKRQLVEDLSTGLGKRFFAFVEQPRTPNEHIHVQRKRATVYSMDDYLRNA
jgi:hypothetical protein